MAASWKYLLPTDTFIVKVNGIIQEFDEKVLTLLYQPIMGASAYSLYLTLRGMLGIHSYVTKPHSHHHLMLLTSQTLPDLYKNRLKLEGLGLLQVYQKKNDEERVFIYELCPPLSPAAFFREEWLAAFLFNHLGKTQFQLIKQQFEMYKVPSEGYKNITKSFPEVFTNVRESEVHLTNEAKELLNNEQMEMIDRIVPGVTHMDEQKFDLSLCLERIPTVILPKEWITDEVKEAIWKLALIYQLDEYTMSEVIQHTCLHQDSFSIDQLREEVVSWYQLNIEEQLPTLSMRKQPNHLVKMKEEKPISQEEKAIQQFETMSPYEVIVSYMEKGAKPSIVDIKLVETIMFEQKLTPGVTNVLIDYVMKTNNGQLPKPLVLKIASHWARTKVKTVPEAIELAQMEHKKRIERKENQRKSKTNTGRKHEVVSDWMKKEDPAVDPKKWEQQKRILEERIKNL